GVGGGDDGSQDGSGAPVEAGKEEVGDGGHSGDGEDDQTEPQQGDADEMETEVPPGKVERAGEDQRRQDDQENERGAERDVRDNRNEAQSQASDDQHDGIGRLE